MRPDRRTLAARGDASKSSALLVAARYERVHWVEAPARCFVLTSTATPHRRGVPACRLKSSLTLRARATARRGESREDYAETCVIPPNEADHPALYDVNATHWCLRVDGIEAQSAWIDVTGVAARGEEVAFVVDDGRQRLRVTLHRLLGRRLCCWYCGAA